MHTADVLLLGSGVAATSCARRLQPTLQTLLLDKARGPGGRCSTRRQLSLRFDHGAQYFTARDPRFGTTLQPWIEQGLIQPWNARFAELIADEPSTENQHHTSPRLQLKASNPERLVALPGNNHLCKLLGADLEILFQSRAHSLQRQQQRWLVLDDRSRPIASAPTLILTPPPPQSAILLETIGLPAAGQLAQRCRQVRMEPCWALMLAFPNPLPLQVDGIFVNHSPFSWIARDSSKPGRPPEQDQWLLHADTAWSRLHLEDDPDTIADTLLEAFFQQLNLAPQKPSFCKAHRWRYARAAEPLDDQHWYNPALQLGLAGDWLHGSRIEGAFLSGLTLAETILDHLR